MWKYSNDTEITVWFHFESMHSAGIFQFSEKIKSFYKEVSFLLKLIFLKFTNYFKLAYGFSFLHRASCVLYYRQKICGKIKIKIHWRPTPVLLPGESHGQRSLVDCSPWVARSWDTTEQLHFHFSLSCIGEGNGNPLQCSCLENPRDRGAWWAAIYGVTQSRTQLTWLSSNLKKKKSKYPKMVCYKYEKKM